MSVPTANDKRPSAPKIRLSDLGKQFVIDVYGKEVQDPSSYSYTWMADQVGHICLGILVYFVIVVIVGALGNDWAAVRWWIGIPAWGTHGVEAAGVIGGALVVALYEFRTFLFDALKARGLFPVDTNLLAANAGIATIYMILGLGVGFAMQVALGDNHPLRGAAIFAILFVLAIVLAPEWLRQKITWQKADLPFVFRLANVPSKGITDLQAAALQTVVSDSAPPDQKPRQVVIGGPIGSGRTELAAGIGTEFAFKNRKVRYLTLTALLELAQTLPPSRSDRNDSGPDNINYWPWTDAQVLVIDDVGPLISASRTERTV
jgi:hypothetical protein